MTRPAYISATGQFLPGEPVDNDGMAAHLGAISEEGLRMGRLFLRRNRIRGRHYAMRPDGTTEWTLAKLGAKAVHDCLDRAGLDRKALTYLASATTQNDLMVPGFASGVQAEAGLPPLEIASLQSVCASGLMALKAAWREIGAGDHEAALAVGAEFSSRYFRPGFYRGTATLSEDGILPADAEFLRWTLSDGAAAALLEPKPAARGISLRIDWISLRSFADRFPPCMTGGGIRGDGAITPWSHAASIEEAARAGAFQLRQDVDVLARMLPVWVGEMMRLVDLGRIVPDAVDWFLCHYSAHNFREELIDLAVRAGCMIDEAKWFTNLYEKGNVGAASLFLLIDDLLRSGKVEPGQTILCAIPESGRCIMGYAQLTAVGPG
ncbi:MAG TPA: 3-oxoacyl-[acyl-carrier-protein] synthase III C-terminal domain-containing protein [Allosphingosinicella sp.]|nr:3-oxoacyl-[acyl-carrier-protein] synthase III C-terminal domain-containing protein [Allosphingosinicella sp.]